MMPMTPATEVAVALRALADLRDILNTIDHDLANAERGALTRAAKTSIAHGRLGLIQLGAILLPRFEAEAAAIVAGATDHVTTSPHGPN